MRDNRKKFSAAAQKKRPEKAAGIILSATRAVLLIGLAYIILYPVLFSLSVSIREPSDMMDPTVIWLPKSLTFDNIKFVIQKTGFTSAFVRTLFLSSICSVLQMLSCAVTGYGFARFKFKGRTILFFMALLTFVFKVYGGYGNTDDKYPVSYRDFRFVCTGS